MCVEVEFISLLYLREIFFSFHFMHTVAVEPYILKFMVL